MEKVTKKSDMWRHKNEGETPKKEMDNHSFSRRHMSDFWMTFYIYKFLIIFLKIQKIVKWFNQTIRSKWKEDVNV